MAAMPKLTARYQRQEWIDDFVVPYGKPVEFDAGPVLLVMAPGELARVDAEIRKASGRRDLGALAALAGLAGDWDGLSEVSVDREGYLAWLALAGLDPQGLDGDDGFPAPAR